MYRFLISVAFTLVCLDAVLARANQLQADTGEQDAQMQHHDRFDFNQEQVSLNMTCMLLHNYYNILQWNLW